MEVGGTSCMSFKLEIIKFHGIPWNFMKFCLTTQEFRWMPFNIPWKSNENWFQWKGCTQSYMEFHGTRWCFIWRHQSSKQFSMGFHGQWNLEIETSSLELLKFHGISVLGAGIPWKSMEFGVGVKFHEMFNIPWNSMEFHRTSLKAWKVPWDLVLVSNSKELFLISINVIIREVYFPVCGMISCDYILDNRSMVEILRCHSFKATFLCPLFLVNGDIPF